MAAPNIPYLRTPDERFQNLPNFPYSPRYLQNGNLRMAYIDEKTGSGAETFLCLHGQPTWSYLYRKMIPIFLNYTTTSESPSRRVIAPDLFGFGRSDKPKNDEVYTFNFHRDALLHFIKSLDLRNITLVVQDWGGILGLTLPITDPSRFKRLIVMNTSLSVGQKPTQGFLDWKAFNSREPDMKIGQLIGRSTRGMLSKAEVDAYDAPYPDKTYKGGVRRFPELVMISEKYEGVDISKMSLRMYGTEDHFKDTDVFMACGIKDPVLGSPVMTQLAKIWRNGCYYTDISDAGHFVQEWGEQVAKLAIQVFEKKSAVEGARKVEPSKASL